MTRKQRRPGTKGGETDPFERAKLPRPKGKVRLPSDIADAAEAALDDLIGSMPDGDDVDVDVSDDEPRTQTRSPSHSELIPADDDDDEILTRAARRSDQVLTSARQDAAAPPARRSKIPLPAPARTTSAHTVPAPARVSPIPSPRSPLPAQRASPLPSLSSTATRPVPSAPPRSITPPRALSEIPPLPRRSSPPVGETPLTRSDGTTSERSQLEAATELPTRAIADETNRVPDDLIVDVASAPVELPIDFDSAPIEVDEREVLTSLQIVVYEESSQLASIQSAIAAAGHTVNVGAAGRDGITRAIKAIRGGGIEVVIAALPGGEEVIEAALALDPRRPVVIAALAGNVLDSINRAHGAGADLAITRPHDVDRLAPVLLAAARLCFEKRVVLAARGAEQMMRSRLAEIADAEPGGLLPFEMFQRVLELEIKRAKRYEYPLSVALFAVEVDPPPPPAGILGILRARAGNALINTIRDIDMATQLDHERFLVLLPYTDLKGSAGLGRRVIASVGALDPVIAGGRTFQPRVVGAVAGGAPGQPLSFAKLMKEATRALEQARRDGAELAVQP